MATVKTSPANLARIEKAFSTLELLMSNLYGRWLDEREYENINDYLVPVNKALATTGTELVATKMNKRPFGFNFSIGEAEYQFFVNSSQYGWKRIK